MAVQPFFSAIMLGALALADVPSMPDEYTLFCVGEQANGFDRTSDRWRKASFNPSRYLIVKSKDNQCDIDKPEVTDFVGLPGYHWREVCLNIREVGEKIEPLLSEKCQEFSIRHNGDWRFEFSCTGLYHDISGNVDGEFRRTVANRPIFGAPLRSEMFIEVGQCSRIN